MNITPIIETVFALIAAVITAIVIPYIRSKTTAQQQTEINAWVRIAVSAAEQIYVGSGRGQEKKAYVLTLVPALFMTVVCISFLMVSNIAFALPPVVGYAIGGGVGLATALWFMVWLRKMRAGARE